MEVTKVMDSVAEDMSSLLVQNPSDDEFIHVVVTCFRQEFIFLEILLGLCSPNMVDDGDALRYGLVMA